MSPMCRARMISPILALVVFAVTLYGCGSAPSGAHRPNVVFIVIDTLRSDHLSFYGYRRETSPFLAELATQGAVFERAASSSSATAPATASIFTSLHPLQHGVVNGLLATKSMQEKDPTIELNRISEGLTTLPEAMKEAGYTTFGITDNLNICPEEGFDQGFDRFVNYRYRSATEVNKKLFEWAAEIEQSGPYFLYLHYMDPHAPYVKRQPAFDAFNDGTSPPIVAAYDSEIDFVDGMIEAAFETFGWDRDTLIVITSDHGEAFNEHGEMGHGKDLFEEVVHVPLVIYEPGRVAPQRVRERVQTMDLYPTILDWLDVEPPTDLLEGVSFAERLLRADMDLDEERQVVSQLVRKKDGRVRYLMSSMTQGDWKYIQYAPGNADDVPVEMLFDLRSDPKERRDMLSGGGEASAKLRDRLRKDLATINQSTFGIARSTTRFALDDDTLEHLRELGYVEE